MMIPPLEIVVRMGTSIGLGAVIGYERGKHDHPAGLRTHAIVAMSATLFMIVSAHALHIDAPSPPGVTVSFDPTRIASYVVAGIGFLGGGAIARVGLSVKGLTTAASLWMVTAVGLSVGAGLYLAAVVGTGFGYAVLEGFRFVEVRPKAKVKRRARLELDGETDVPGLLDRLRDAGNRGTARRSTWNATSLPGCWSSPSTSTTTPRSEAVALLAALERLPGLRRVALSHREDYAAA